jgi:predicted NAD-dependent protein-ADP-ribosyltransferase YbiA (DUF1768 family)
MIRLRKDVLVIEPAGEEAGPLRDWLAAHVGKVFWLRESKDKTLIFHSLGDRADACREPLNITSRSRGSLNLISNFAATPFVLDEQGYASIEGFWQGLKFPADDDRRRLAGLAGSEAKDAGYYAPPADHIIYLGQDVRVGTWDHWRLMERACSAKFEQHAAAREALLSTGTRPLVHQTKPDSRSIPGVIMADIWMRLRERHRT